MDVAKYIGLFLLKNNFVYIHGLGNLEIQKKPSSFNGDSLLGPSYEVVMTPMGSIDDNLANFIATNEQISISKASNALREFSQNAREELQKGKTVVIPAIGSFIEENRKTNFITDPAFQHSPAAIPSVRVARRQDETVYTTNADIPAVKPRYIDPDTEIEPSSISWIKVAAWALGLGLIGVLAYFGIQYLNSQDNTGEVPLIQGPVQDTVQSLSPVITDTTDNSPAGAANIASEETLNFDVILNTYIDLAKAQRRLDKLKSYGNNVSLVSEADSTVFYVILPVSNAPAADTAHLLDSLKRVFNPTYGVKILQ